jgi:hypothetical protein
VEPGAEASQQPGVSGVSDWIAARECPRGQVQADDRQQLGRPNDAHVLRFSSFDATRHRAADPNRPANVGEIQATITTGDHELSNQGV